MSDDPDSHSTTLNSNVYVRGLPIYWSSSEFNGLFSQYGPIISSRILYNPLTNTSRGMGFIRFKNHSDATLAIAKLDGFTPEGSNKALACKFAKDGGLTKDSGLLNNDSARYNPYPTTKVRVRPLGSLNEQEEEIPIAPAGRDSNNLYIVDLPLNLTEADLRQLYQQYGPLTSTAILTDSNTGLSRGIGLARFVHSIDAGKAMKSTQGLILEGSSKPILVRYARSMGNRGQYENNQQNQTFLLSIPAPATEQQQPNSAFSLGPQASLSCNSDNNSSLIEAKRAAAWAAFNINQKLTGGTAYDPAAATIPAPLQQQQQQQQPAYYQPAYPYQHHPQYPYQHQHQYQQQQQQQHQYPHQSPQYQSQPYQPQYYQYQQPQYQSADPQQQQQQQQQQYDPATVAAAWAAYYAQYPHLNPANQTQAQQQPQQQQQQQPQPDLQQSPDKPAANSQFLLNLTAIASSASASASTAGSIAPVLDLTINPVAATATATDSNNPNSNHRSSSNSRDRDSGKERSKRHY